MYNRTSALINGKYALDFYAEKYGKMGYVELVPRIVNEDQERKYWLVKQIDFRYDAYVGRGQVSPHPFKDIKNIPSYGKALIDHPHGLTMNEEGSRYNVPVDSGGNLVEDHD